jgi:hypothetical protein
MAALPTSYIVYKELSFVIQGIFGTLPEARAFAEELAQSLPNTEIYIAVRTNLFMATISAAELSY